jgi:hypothetical protein
MSMVQLLRNQFRRAVLVSAAAAACIATCAGAQPCQNILTEEFEGGYRQLETSNFGGDIRIAEGANGTKGVVIERRRAGGDDTTFLRRRLPAEYAGRVLKVEVMLKYENLTAGPEQEYHHGGHVDYEAFTPKGPRYPSQTIFLGTQSEWSLHSVDWVLPKDATNIRFRMGLQGVSGRIYFDNLKLWICQ